MEESRGRCGGSRNVGGGTSNITGKKVNRKIKKKKEEHGNGEEVIVDEVHRNVTSRLFSNVFCVVDSLSVPHILNMFGDWPRFIVERSFC